jgi:hypothetical protein
MRVEDQKRVIMFENRSKLPNMDVNACRGAWKRLKGLKMQVGVKNACRSSRMAGSGCCMMKMGNIYQILLENAS